jgi:thiol-disulfide isomerase/thioredoxin
VPKLRITAIFLLVLWLPAALAEKPQLRLTDLEGREHRLADYRGQWVIVNYWATWCPPCREELPELEIFHANNQGNAVVWGVNLEDIDDASLKQFVDEQFLSFPVLRGDRSSMQALGPVPGLPTTYVISPAGEVVARQVGPVTREGIEKFIAGYRPVAGD